jgi:tight adherence protein C
MIWIQLAIPVIVAAVGVFLLITDSYNKHVFIGNQTLASIKTQKFKRLENSYQGIASQLQNRFESQRDFQDVRGRLSELGKLDTNSFGNFRYQQIVTSTLISLLPFFGLIAMKIDLLPALIFSFILWFGSFMAIDRYLSEKVKQHRFQVESEFPAIIEMLTLAIGAGETPLNAFARISERSSCKLTQEFSKVVAQVRLGKPFHEALDGMARNLKSDSIRRFIDALVMAMLRGAPIVEVLHRHVAEARINHRNLVMDKAGKAETTMMIPIVFLILPISVLFALWPSINQLSFFAG